jgi:hypothetical protein
MGWFADHFGDQDAGAGVLLQLRDDFRTWCQRLGEGRLNPDDDQQLGWWIEQREQAAALAPDCCSTCGGMESLRCPANCSDDMCTLCWGEGSIDCPACVGYQPAADGTVCLTCHNTGGVPCACGGLTEDCQFCEDGIIPCEYCNHGGY